MITVYQLLHDGMDRDSEELLKLTLNRSTRGTGGDSANQGQELQLDSTRSATVQLSGNSFSK